jgi:hypothetical protein
MIKERILKEKNPLSEDSLRKIVEETEEKAKEGIIKGILC